MSSLPAWRLGAKTGEKDATSKNPQFLTNHHSYLCCHKSHLLHPTHWPKNIIARHNGRISTWELLIQVMDSMGFFSFQNPSGVRHSLHVRKALELVTHFTLRGILWKQFVGNFPKFLRVFGVSLNKLLLQVPKVRFEQNEKFLNTCLLTKRLQVGKSNIPIHVSIWFFRLFPTWRVVPNTYFGWGLGEVQRRTSRKEKPYLQSPKGLLVKLLVPFSISSPKKDHF